MKKVFGFACLFLSGLTFHSAKADTIGGASCATCNGSTYTLTYAATSNPDAFDVTLTIDASGYTNPADSLNAVALQLTTKKTQLISETLVLEPATFSGTVTGGLNGNGCDGSGPGYLCSVSGTNGLAVGGSGDIYTFEWLVTVDSPSSLLTGLDAATVEALYNKPQGSHDNITDEAITLTGLAPEPSTLLLLGTGLAGMAGIARRRLVA